MRLMNLFTSCCFLLLTFIFQSCQKDFIIKQPQTYTEQVQNLKKHQSNVEIWLKLIPLNGSFKNAKVIQKTIKKDNSIITSVKFSENGNSFLFITLSNKFHTYGLNSNFLKKGEKYNGKVVVYDFQNLSKYDLNYKNDNLQNIGLYKNIDYAFNAYQNKYPNFSNKSVKQSVEFSNTTLSTNSSPNSILNGIRKFFCELFGGEWVYAPYSIDTPQEYCAGNSNTNEQPTQSILAPSSGGEILGSLLYLINNPNYFDINNGIWYDVLPWYSGGGSTSGTNVWSANTMFIDTACSNPDLIRTLFFALNTKNNQQQVTSVDGTIEEMLFEFEASKNQQQVLIPIIPWLIKAGANGAADALTQALFIYLIEDDCPSFGAAFGHSKFSKAQVARSAAEGLIPWSSPGGKLGKAAFSAIGDVLINIIEDKYGTNNYQEMGKDFMLGFFSDLAGGAVGDLASKYSIPKIGKGLLNKFDIHYKTVTSWLGGGLQQINKSFVHNGQTITASRVMKGFADNKVAVIGRNMADRVTPFSNSLSNELGVPVLTWQGFNNQLSEAQNLANNQAWIKSLKEQGYTFYDVGLDPNFTSQGNLVEGPFYAMELNEIFR